MKSSANRFPTVLKSMAASFSAATVILLLWNRCAPQAALVTAAISTGTTAYHFLMRLAVGYLVPRSTGYRFDWNRAWFQPRSWEAPLYKHLKVKHWKNQLPTYAPSQFSLAELPLQQVIRNMCGAEIVHEIIMVLSFLPVLTVPFFGGLPVFLITSALAALFDCSFVMAQRYNRPRLVRIYEKQEARCL